MYDKITEIISEIVNKTLQVAVQFCTTMAARGEIVRKRVRESGYSVSRLAEKIGISRTQLYADFSNPEMSLDRILAIGKILHHDFSEDFRDLPAGIVQALNGPEATVTTRLQECQATLLAVQTQLIAALHELNRYKNKYGPEPA